MPKTRFAERLQRIMSEQNLSQSDLARLIWGTMTDERGYTVARNRQVLGKYVSGTVEPRMDTKRRMAEVLGVSMSTLAPESDPWSRPGSGLYAEPVDRKHKRLEIKVVVPNEVATEVGAILLPYAV